MNDFQINLVQVSDALVGGELQEETYIALVSGGGIVG